MKMIEVVAPFKHDSAQYFLGERRMVSDEDAAYFCKHGWATCEGLVTGTPDVSPKTLDVQDGKHRNKGEIR